MKTIFHQLCVFFELAQFILDAVHKLFRLLYLKYFNLSILQLLNAHHLQCIIQFYIIYKQRIFEEQVFCWPKLQIFNFQLPYQNRQ
jgi:hypothetical protein